MFLKWRDGLDFKDFMCYKKIILVEQVWRPYNNHSSLLYNSLKIKCFLIAISKCHYESSTELYVA